MGVYIKGRAIFKDILLASIASKGVSKVMTVHGELKEAGTSKIAK